MKGVLSNNVLEASVSSQQTFLFTAPHCVRVKREDSVHARERYTGEIAKGLAEHLEGSFVIWNGYDDDVNAKEPRNEDPNFLTASQSEKSVWVAELKKFWKTGLQKKLHIDVHGKKNKKKGPQTLDIGWMPMKMTMDDAKRAKDLVVCFENKLLPCLNDKGYAVDIDPALHGYWGGDLFTLSHQSVRLGGMAVQFEIPAKMRTDLGTDTKFLENFAKAIQEAHQDFIN